MDTAIMATAMAYPKGGEKLGEPIRKKLKTSDLPLASATRGAIENLAHAYKKKGGYDTLRKQVWDDLEKSVSFILDSYSCQS
jgi:hypothetical protein